MISLETGPLKSSFGIQKSLVLVGVEKVEVGKSLYIIGVAYFQGDYFSLLGWNGSTSLPLECDLTLLGANEQLVTGSWITKMKIGRMLDAQI